MTFVRPVRCLVVVVSALVLSAAVSVGAQDIVYNPHAIFFVASSDHLAVTADGQPVVVGYDLEIFQVGAPEPMVVLNLGKPAPAEDGSIQVEFASLFSSPPITGVALEARVVTMGPTGRGPSEPSNLFEFDGPAGASSGVSSKPASTLLRITQPTGGAAIRLGEALTITASVDAPVRGVDFYANGLPIGTAPWRPWGPYRVRWVSRTAGTYAITAVTVDGNGVQAISAPVLVTVGRAASHSRVAPRGAVTTGKAKGRG